MFTRTPIGPRSDEIPSERNHEALTISAADFHKYADKFHERQTLDFTASNQAISVIAMRTAIAPFFLSAHEVTNMANTNQGNRGGDHASHEQHVKSGEHSHKNQEGKQASQDESGSSGGQRGGSHEQHVKAGQQSHKKD